MCNYVWRKMLAKHCGDYCAIYTYGKSLCCTPKPNTMLYVSYISITNIKKKEMKLKEK